MEDNSHAGQGAVLLDIGGDVGALVVLMPVDLAGEEIEARPVGGHGHPVGGAAAGHAHGHGPGGHGPGEHGPGEHGPGEHGPGPLVHVAVLPRPVPDGRFVHSAVFGELPAGTYELYRRPTGPVRLTVEVAGGAVTEAVWP